MLPRRSCTTAVASLDNVDEYRTQGITMQLLAPKGAIVKGSSCLVMLDGPSDATLPRTAPRRRSGARRRPAPSDRRSRESLVEAAVLRGEAFDQLVPLLLRLNRALGVQFVDGT